MAFSDSLRYGQAGESVIAQWLRGKGYTVMPVYEKIFDTGKGPQLYLPNDEKLIAPDMLAINGKDNIRWIEAKHKTAFSWHRISNSWVTGIDLRHYHDYLKVAVLSPWPVWLLFLHRGGQAKDSPANSPAGLFGNPISYLKDNESHRSDKWANGMVYWSRSKLQLLAALEEIEQLGRVVA
jgi:hypothetical protein